VVSTGGVPYEYLEPGDHPVVTLADGRAERPLKPTAEMPPHLGIMREMYGVSAIGSQALAPRRSVRGCSPVSPVRLQRESRGSGGLNCGLQIAPVCLL